KNLDTIYSILDKEEKEVLEEVVREDGEINQTEISEKHGKIKAHRIIKKLQEKKIIDIKKTGRTNKIKIKEGLKKELLK
ncbi:MAG: helix-turn-helix transcriptional regulator, partial [Minisyncoccales bacterium]